MEPANTVSTARLGRDLRHLSQDRLLLRKPVRSQSTYETSDGAGVLRNSNQPLPLPRYNETAQTSSRADDAEQHSSGWRASDQSTQVNQEPTSSSTSPNDGNRPTESLLTHSPAKVPDTYRDSIHSTWLPKTLTWPYLLMLILVSLALATLIGFLTWYSTVHTGIGNNSNSNLLLFGWRFSPTLVAVVYAIMETMLLIDIRRTEVFARLTRNSSSSASSTILHGADAWWNDPREALRTQKDGHWRSWALFWSSMATILGMFVISPLSAGLLSIEDIEIIRDSTFSKTAAFHKLPLEASADDATYVRSIASSTIGLTTSAWLTDEFAILPFWPSHYADIPLSSLLASSPQKWHGNTTVFQVVMNCNFMWLSQAGYQPEKTLYPAPYKLDAAMYVPAYHSLQLASDDGCIYEFAVSKTQNVQIFDVGGGWWSKTSGSNYPASDVNTDPYGLTLVVNNSTECGDREILFTTSPFLNSSTRAAGQLCSSEYYHAELLVTVTTSSSQSSVSFDEVSFNKIKRPMAPDFNIESFDEIFLGSQWRSKFVPPGSSTDNRPLIGGPLLPIAVLYNWDLEEAVTNGSILNKAQATKQRFLGEALQKTFATIGQDNVQSVPGQIVAVQQRLMLNFAIGVTLAGLLLLSALMYAAVLFHSRLERRPLGVARDPASAAAVATLIVDDDLLRSCFEGADRVSKQGLSKSLTKTSLRLRSGGLRVVDDLDQPKDHIGDLRSHTDWRPTVLHSWSALTALAFIAVLVGGIVTAFVESHKSALYQTFFVYQKNVSIGKNVTAAIAPYSIIPTLLAVILKVWWSAIESVFKRMQPYVNMARRPTKASEGIALSYVDSIMLWASWKAMRNRHWLLALITMGAFLTEVFTVSMSALWSREPGQMSKNIVVPRQLEIRTIPSIFKGTPAYGSHYMGGIGATILAQIYGSVLNSWLYGGLVEMAYGGSAALWTEPGSWAFAPVDTSRLSIPTIQKIGSNSTTGNAKPRGSATNITVDTPGIRARLECTQIDLSNTSAWLQTLDFTKDYGWNRSTTPSDLKTGYALSAANNGELPLDLGPYKDVWENNVTTFFTDIRRLTCCANETEGSPGRSAIGYWSFNSLSASDLTAGEANFTIKWIVGQPYAKSAQNHSDTSGAVSYFVWRDMPLMTALNCKPVFETVQADVTIDLSSLTVQEYNMTGKPQIANEAWSDYWITHANSSDWDYVPKASDGSEILPEYLNVTVSYGWLFLQALLRSADTDAIGDVGGGSFNNYVDEKLDDRTFNFRQTALNTDFMSYSALALANNNVEALLNPSTLYNISDYVFATFFQHFVGGNVSWTDGSYGFQSINATVPWTLGPIFNGTEPAAYQDRNVSHHLEPTIQAMMSIQIEQLHVSPTAVYLCLGILAFLAATTILMFTRYRRYFKSLPRDVDCLASVIGFVYASPRLLEWVQEHKHEKDWGLGRDKGEGEVMARMGWFGDGGRWGIELVGEGKGREMEDMGRTGKRHRSLSSEMSAETAALFHGPGDGRL